MKDNKRKQVGLALGGGGSRGFAHIGVLKVLEAESIPVDMIGGTSIGAVIGGAYASGLGPEALAGKVSELAAGPLSRLSIFKAMEDPQESKNGLVHKIGLFFRGQWLFTQALFNPGMIGDKDFQAVINHFIPDIRIEETRIPFRAVAVNLIDGQEVVLSSGPMREAVMASCAVPGFMPPVKIGDMQLVDGGTINMMPCGVVRQLGSDVVIGVDVDRAIGADKEFNNAIDVYTRAAMIGSFHLSNICLREADVVIKPRVGDMKWFELSQATETIEEGERSARESMEEIRRLVQTRPVGKAGAFFQTFKSLFGKKPALEGKKAV